MNRKLGTSFTLFLMLFSIGSAAAEFNYEGIFDEKHPVYFLAYDEQECKKNNGIWDGECSFDSADTVEIKKDETNKDKFTIIANTVTTNAHTCDFEASGAILNIVEKKITVSTLTEIYNAATGNMEPDMCELTVSYSDENTVSVTTNDKCSGYCGHNAYLTMRNATRRK